MVAALGGMLRAAEMFFHLDLQTRLEDLLGQLRQQPARADKTFAVRKRPIRPLLARVIRQCRHRHIMICHGCLSFQPSKTLSVSGQTSYTADLTVPLTSDISSERPSRPPSGGGAIEQMTASWPPSRGRHRPRRRSAITSSSSRSLAVRLLRCLWVTNAGVCHPHGLAVVVDAVPDPPAGSYLILPLLHLDAVDGTFA
jgi:hypothetical protein